LLCDTGLPQGLDALKTGDERWKMFRQDLFDISHREYSPAFSSVMACDPTMGRESTRAPNKDT
jgi:putative protease